MNLLKQIDETISFNENNIRVIGTYQEPWFVAKDICNILELKNVTEAMKIIPEKWRGSEKLNTFGGDQNMLIINEAGLYKLIMRSNKPVAQKFQEVVCEDILPSLRKKGEYKIQSIINKNKELEEEKVRLENEKKLKDAELNKKNKEIKQLHTLVKKKAKKKYSYSHCVYIISNPDIKNCFKIGLTGDRNNRLDALAPGAPRPYNIEYSRELQNAKEETAIESLLLGIFDKYRVVTDTKNGRQREWIENIDLNTLKNEMNNIVDYYQKRREYFNKKFKEENENEDNEIEEDTNTEEDVENDQKIDDEKVNIKFEDESDVEKEDESVIESDVEKEDKRDFKICYVCHEEKSLDDYYDRIENVDGKEGTCKKCYSNNKKILKLEKYEREVIKRDEGTKKCRTCLEIKEFKNFMKHGTSKDGYSYECNDCKVVKNNTIEKKRCEKCRTTKQLTEFNTFRLGYSKCCKQCEINNPNKENEDLKKCSGCKNELSLDNFSKAKSSSDGLYNYCKECGKLKSKKTKEKYKLQEKEIVNEKVCISCNQNKSIGNYFKCNTEKDGYKSKCKICVKDNEKQIINSLTK
jgi:prophage antirepressor-like protein